MANVLPILLAGGAAAAFFMTQKKKTGGGDGGLKGAGGDGGLKGAGPEGSGIMSSGMVGTTNWRVMKMFKDNFMAQWALPRNAADGNWTDAADFPTEKEARQYVIQAIHDEEIPG